MKFTTDTSCAGGRRKMGTGLQRNWEQIGEVSRKIRLGGLLALAFFFCLRGRCAGESTVFQIGVPDGDYSEFAIAGHWQNYATEFPHDVDFVVGRSDPGKDWPYVQPGPEDGWAGHRAHTFRIHFPISEPVSGYYRLVLDLVSTHPNGVPRLIIDINGEQIEQSLPPGSSDQALNNPRDGKHCSLEQVLPGALFRQGENIISLTIAEGSWLLYDDVRLESGVAAPHETLSLKAEALPFFARAGKQLRRAVRVSIENVETGTMPAELAWTAKGLSGSQKFNLHFGHNELLVKTADSDEVELELRAGQRKVHLGLQPPPARKWRVFIVPTTHTDIGYTDLQERVRVRHAENGLSALNLLDQYPKFKWYSETFWQLNALLQLHPEKTEEVFQRSRQQRWGLSGDYANMLTGLCSSEALNRLTLDSRNLANKGNFVLNSVILDDVPSAIAPVPMVLANSGIKYFIEGENNDRAPYSGNVPMPFYWEGADGSRVLAAIVRGYGQAGGVIPSLQGAMARLPEFLERFDTPDYPCDAALVNGAFSDNRQIRDDLPEIVKQWNAQWAYPQLIFALPSDYFQYVEKNYSNAIPVLKTDFGGWWEDGAGSTALETTLSRRAEQRATAAEMLHSLAGIVAQSSYPKSDFDDLWHNVLLYNEHTWGAAGSISHPDSEQTVEQWKVKASFAHAADAESRQLVASGMDKLAEMVPPADLIVFNQLAWTRNALVKTDQKAEAVRDIASQQLLPCQPLPEGGSCFVAPDLPGIGYRSYQAGQRPNQPLPDAVQVSGDQMENEYYRVVLNPKTGGIQSIYDKQTGRELVDSDSEYNLGELIYVTGGEGTYAVHSDLRRLPPPKFEYHRQTPSTVEESAGPVFGELVSHATNMDFPGITMRVRLYRGLKQLDLIWELDKTETLNKEAVYLAFPFAVDASKGGLWLEYPDQISEPLKAQHASACRDWYSVQRWLAISDGEATVELSPLDSPLFTLGEMTASTWVRELHLHRGHVFAYLMNNYWHTNYKARQGGRLVFRFSITSSTGPFSKRDAVVNGWNMYCPPIAGRGRAAHSSAFQSAAESMVEVGPDDLPVTTIKQAEAGDGFVVRCCDYSGDAGTARLSFPRPATATFGCNLVEMDDVNLGQFGRTILVPINPFGLITLKAQFNTEAGKP